MPESNEQSNPMLSQGAEERRKNAEWALETIFSSAPVYPVNMYVRKDEVHSSAVVTAPSGQRVIDQDTFWLGPLAQFALFLTQREARGEVWWDQLGSEKEQRRRQSDWEDLVDYDLRLSCVDRELQFHDSRSEDLIQVADMMSGVIWAAAEGYLAFLERLIEHYVPLRERTYLLGKVTD